MRDPGGLIRDAGSNYGIAVAPSGIGVPFCGIRDVINGIREISFRIAVPTSQVLGGD